MIITTIIIFLIIIIIFAVTFLLVKHTVYILTEEINKQKNSIKQK